MAVQRFTFSVCASRHYYGLQANHLRAVVVFDTAVVYLGYFYDNIQQCSRNRHGIHASLFIQFGRNHGVELFYTLLDRNFRYLQEKRQYLW